MKLYHGSNMEIDSIELSKCRPYKDFGRGFYLTTLPEQAKKMAERVTRIYGGSPAVTIFDFDNSCLTNRSLNYRIFNSPSKEWALFVMNNRNRQFISYSTPECNHDNKYDIVIGPIANDDLALLFRQFTNGMIDLNILVNGMRFKKLTNQYSFHTPKAISYLRKEGVLYD